MCTPRGGGRPPPHRGAWRRPLRSQYLWRLRRKLIRDELLESSARVGDPGLFLLDFLVRRGKVAPHRGCVSSQGLRGLSVGEARKTVSLEGRQNRPRKIERTLMLDSGYLDRGEVLAVGGLLFSDDGPASDQDTRQQDPKGLTWIQGRTSHSLSGGMVSRLLHLQGHRMRGPHVLPGELRGCRHRDPMITRSGVGCR